MATLLILSLLFLPTTLLGQTLPSLDMETTQPPRRPKPEEVAPIAQKGEKVVVFAKENIRRCHKITRNLLELKAINTRYLPQHPVAHALEEVLGKYSTEFIVHGEAILLRRISKKEELPYISFKLKDNKKRGVIIATKTQTPPPADSYIDVKFIPGKDNKKDKPHTVANKLRVIASEIANLEYYFVTLEATPETSLKLLLKWKSGSYELYPSANKGDNK